MAETMAAQFERYHAGLILAAFMERLGVDRVTITRDELLALGRLKVLRREEMDGSITFAVVNK